MESIFLKPMNPLNTSKHKQRGLSLVEIMIAMLISLFLLGGVIQVYSSTRITYRTNEGLSRLQENARFVFDRIAADLSAAGFLGCNDSNDRDQQNNLRVFNRLALGGATPDPTYNFSNPVGGANASGPSHLGTNTSDTLIIRRSIGGSAVKLVTPYEQDTADPSISTLFFDTSSPNINLLEQYQTVALSDCESTAIFMITNNPDPTVGAVQFAPGVVSPPTEINPGQSNIGTNLNGVFITDLKSRFGQHNKSTATIYRIATTNYNIVDGVNSNAASGYSLALNGTEFVEDVTDMQILFGLDADGIPGAEQYVRANSAALAAAGMNAVASMQVSLTLEAPNVQVNSQPVRKTFTQTFRLRNR